MENTDFSSLWRMSKPWCLPVLMVKNEELYIGQVLRVLASAFPEILIGDTGSTDGTRNEIARVQSSEPWPNIIVLDYGPQDEKGLGFVRQDMCRWATKMLYQWVFQVDGDELYYKEFVRYLVKHMMPSGKRVGFTHMVSVEKDENGQFWMMDDFFSRAAIYPSTDTYSGDYPFDVPESFTLGQNNSDLYYYYPSVPNIRVHGFHLHRLKRSSKDHEVLLRDKKRYQYSYQDQEHKRTWSISNWPVPL